jgi:hypothetical protein
MPKFGVFLIYGAVLMPESELHMIQTTVSYSSSSTLGGEAHLLVVCFGGFLPYVHGLHFSLHSSPGHHWPSGNGKHGLV